jgi:hypothetical protein
MEQNFLRKNETQLYPSWIFCIPHNSWVPPVSPPKLTEEQINSGYDYEWDENLYQINGANGNQKGWVLIKK